MTALLRYALLKSGRTGFLTLLLVGPFCILTAPLLGIGIGEYIQGRGRYPFTFARQATAAASASAMMTVAIFLATAAAAAAGFWIFRREVETRDIGLVVLATPPRSIAFAATLYGTVIGTLVYLGGIVIVKAMTTHVIPNLTSRILFVMLSSLCASSLGVFLVGIKPEKPMLIAVYAGAVGVGIFVGMAEAPSVIPLAIAGAALLMTFSAVLLRRRCAT